MTDRQRVLEVAARLYVCFFLNFYGLGKLIGGQFYRRGSVPEDIARIPLAEAGAFDLAWVFMGYSTLYVVFIGLAEMIGACLLLTERTKLLGVAILLPIMANILVFDVVFLDRYGALASAFIYTALLLVIVLCNRLRVIEVWHALTAGHAPLASQIGNLPRFALAVAALMAAVFGLDQYLVNLFGHGRG